MKTNKVPTKFYNDLWTWIQTNESTYFNPHVGICANLFSWTKENNYTSDEANELYKRLQSDFIEAGLGSDTPFNSEPFSYVEERNKYTNYARITWIQSHIHNPPLLNFAKVSPYDALVPQVAIFGNEFCIIGTTYGYIHTTAGDVRTWKTISGAKKFLKKYCSTRS